MPNAAALWTLLRAAHHHNVAVEQARREQVETHGPYLDESESPDDPATPEQPESPWDCVLRKVAEVILKRVHGAGASTEAALHDQKNLEGVCEKLRGHYEPLMKATSRQQPREKVCEGRCEQDESNAKDKETENLSNALADDIREVFAIERLCDGLDLSRNWEITLPGEGQRLLDDLFLLLESRDWTARTVANFQKDFPVVAAEMGLETLVEAAPAAGGETPAGTDQTPDVVDQYVTLDMMAGLVNRNKKTLERWLSDGKLPAADVEGGGGKPHEWKWCNIREPLENVSGKRMPQRFPTLHQT